MKKYIGILTITNEYINGLETKILTKTYDNKNLLEKWFSLYPNSLHIILENNEVLDSMFKAFEDSLTPITLEEIKKLKEAEEEVKVLLKYRNNLI